MTGPIPGSKSRSLRHDASSRGLTTIRKCASTSLMCACSKKRSPLRTGVRDAAREQLALNQNAVVMVAIEHGHLPKRQPLVALQKHLLANQAAST